MRRFQVTKKAMKAQDKRRERMPAESHPPEWYREQSMRYATGEMKREESVHEDYPAYLKSAEWKAKRMEVFVERGRKCERCGSTRRIQVHHKTYANIGKEKL